MDHEKHFLALCNDDPWPADTECRRIKDLQDYLARYPNYLGTAPSGEREDMVAQAHVRYSGLEVQCMGNDVKDLVERTPAVDRRIRAGRRRNSGVRKNKWDLQSTLELLEAMKAYVIRHEKPFVGNNLARWTEVVDSLANPRSIEPKSFARSCMVKYMNIQRCIRRSKKGRVGVQVRQSVRDFVQLCQRYGKIVEVRSQSQNKIRSPQRQTQSAHSEDTLPTQKPSTPRSRNRTRKLSPWNGRGDERSAAGLLPDMSVVV